MNITSRVRSKPGSFIGKLLSASLSVWMLGVAFSPALAAITVDQAPLIVQKPLPPNITLMLDDSGSMAWDYMPDWGYLKNRGNPDAVIDSTNNGTYYNPTFTYTPPVKADGTSYPSATGLTSAWADGFRQSGSQDLTNYSESFNYSTAKSLPRKRLNTYLDSNVSSSACVNDYNYYNYYYSSNGAVTSNFVKNSNNSYGNCTITYYTNPSVYNYFQYSTGPAAGPYVVYYVASSDCGGLSNCVLASDTTGVSAPKGVAAGQNIANWFSYYHTRILMAKSGLMNSFAGIDATYRVGFGSIDGGDGGNSNYLNLPASRYSYADSYNTGTNYIAKVQPFGLGTDASSQKSAFWNWVDGATANGGTPLRQALNAVGQYYGTDQPWQTDTAAASGTNELACRQSYTILTTDGFWNGNTPANVGDVDGTASTKAITGPENTPYLYTPVLPYADGTISSTSGYVSASCPRNFTIDTSTGTCTRRNYASVSACAAGDTYDSANPGKQRCIHVTITGSNSDTLADVAMKYWLTDLRPNTVNEVPKSAEDPAFWQHMTTFTLGLGFTPTGITPAGTTIDQIFKWANGGAPIAGFSWPTPASNDIKNIADLAHAAVNGHGGFYSATSPDSFTSGLKDALKRAASRVGTGASLAANSTELKTGTFAYQANYHTAKWTGDLKAIKVDPDNGSLAPTATWSAADPTVLPAFGSRKIYTYNPSVTPAAAVAFTVPTNLSSAEQTALGSTAADQQNMINYLRGDNSLEQSQPGGTFRTRETPLGDIVDSQPVFVGQPDPNIFTGETFAGSTAFAAYASTARSGQLMVAANDGMLHVFNADTGVEDYAYLPAAVITSGLKQLANPDYGTTLTLPHQYFNDGELTVADVYYGSAWHSIAVGTTGRGLAKAIYALDVTTSTPKFLWERSAGDTKGNQDYIGQMTGKPIIAQTADGVWSVLMGNGYNSKNGVAALLQFAVADGTLTVHATTDASTGNGLAAPAVWLGDLTNGISTIAYAGDALGQVWSFGLNDGTTAATATPSSVGTLLFSAGASQPITAGMLAGKDPATGNLWVFFGTGQYLSTGDLSSTATQAWYGLIVKSDTAGLAVSSSKGLTDLVQRSIIAETPGTAAVVADPNATPPVVGQNAVAPARAVTLAAGATSMSGKSGWYLNLLSPSSTTAPDPKDKTKTITTYTPNAIAQGERIVTSSQFQGNQLLATTRIPQATDLCNPSGRGWIMSVDPFTGTSPQSSFFDLNGDGQINSPADTINVGGVQVPASGIGFSSLPNNPIFVGGNMLVSFDNGNATSIKTSGSGGTLKRVSWRELINP